MTGVIYPISTHWCWASNGWLGQLGFYDFAGSGVVHLAGGTCALVGAIILGPRMDRFGAEDKSIYGLPAHNMPHISLGGFILVAGFMAFNGGSQASITKGQYQMSYYSIHFFVQNIHTYEKFNFKIYSNG